MLKDQIPTLLSHINKHADYLDNNAKLLDIYEGNLVEYIQKDLQASLSSDYYNKIKERIIPINILQRLVDKMAKAYATEPSRSLIVENKDDQELLDYYEDILCINNKGNDADEFSHLFKGYAWEPFVDDGVPMLRTIPYDKFLPYSNSNNNPEKVTVFIKSIGERTVRVIDKRSRDGFREEMRPIYYAYSNDEFVAFDSFGEEYERAYLENDGINPIGVIPFIYGSRAKGKLIPTQDSDIFRMSKVIPVMLSDISGAILFQCFSIIWGVDLDMENAPMSPNALWSLKSDADSDKTPQIGTIKPEADIDKVMTFILNTFALWLETKGIKVGSIGDTQGAMSASGISKIIDEADTTELRKKAISHLKKEEEKLWQLIKKMHNHWVVTGEITGMVQFSESFEVAVVFDEPKPMVDRDKFVRTIDFEVSKGYMDPETAIRELYPDLDNAAVKKRLENYNSMSVVVDASTESDDQDTESVQPEREEGDIPGDN